MEAAAATATGDDHRRLAFGIMEYGCEHYKRRCKIRAPCCDEVFGCRHCHNEATAKDDRHELPRHDVKRVICLVCATEQPAEKVCSNCGVNMGEYFCDVCKFYDDELKNDSFTVMTVAYAGSCYDNGLQDRHKCVENSMKHQCPICLEYLFDSLGDARILNCGHTMHFECFREMIEHNKEFVCFSHGEKNNDDFFFQVAATAMPEEEHYKVWIFCNDCHESSEVYFHVLGDKCTNCESYNTRRSDPPANFGL